MWWGTRRTGSKAAYPEEPTMVWAEGRAQQYQRQRVVQKEKDQQSIIYVVPVGTGGIGRREGDVGCISVVVWVVDGVGCRRRRQLAEQVVMVVLLFWVLMVVPDQPEAWQRQPGKEDHHETQVA